VYFLERVLQSADHINWCYTCCEPSHAIFGESLYARACLSHLHPTGWKRTTIDIFVLERSLIRRLIAAFVWHRMLQAAIQPVLFRKPLAIRCFHSVLAASGATSDALTFGGNCCLLVFIFTASAMIGCCGFKFLGLLGLSVHPLSSLLQLSIKRPRA